MSDRAVPETIKPRDAHSLGRLISVDVLRGLAAMGVVLFHSAGGLHKLAGVQDWTALPLQFFCAYGFTGVYLFFVISGFCIHIRWARATHASGTMVVPGFAAFWQRRFWRLYPPYLAALFCSLLVEVVIGDWPARNTSAYDNAYDLILHLAMLHNLDQDTVYSINPVFWTLAIEEQLYLAYFLLLWLRRRLMWMWLLIVLLVARIVWFIFVAALYETCEIQVPAHPGALAHWFEWGLGALAVEGYVGLVRLPVWSRNWVFGGLVLLAAAGVSYLHQIPGFPQVAEQIVSFIESPLWGIGFFIVLNAAVSDEVRWRGYSRPVLVRWLACVGLMSYSLYLTHLSTIHLFSAIGWQAELEAAHLWLSVVILSAVSLGASCVFYQVVEKPFISGTVPIVRG